MIRCVENSNDVRLVHAIFVAMQWNYLKCICNENFDCFIFALPKNSIFSDHFDTNLVEKFELKVCEFLVQSWAVKILADEIPARPKGHYDVCSVTQCAFLIYKYYKQHSFNCAKLGFSNN